MELTKDVGLLEGMPIAHIKSLNALVVADLHLGYEAYLAKSGIFAPKANLKKILEMLSSAFEKTKASNLIIDGDIKNEFSTVEPEEFNELYDLINFAKEKKITLYLIKGNHDNFVERYKEPFRLNVHRQQAMIGKYLFFHGEEMPKIEKAERKKVEMLIMGHEHPSIGITDNLGRREKLRCFLFGTYKSLPLLVLPAMGFYASSTDLLLEPPERLLSPIFKHVDIEAMHAIAVGYGSTIDFGKIGKLKQLR
ncbi:MAG: metallophosphoesterase [Candidatus Micrarchaeaceae archaeon]